MPMIRGHACPLTWRVGQCEALSYPSQVERRVKRSHAGQNMTLSLMAASTFDGTTFRATKSSQFLNGPLARASTMALARAGPTCGSVSSSVAVAVFKLIFFAIGAVATGVGVAGLAGAAAAGAAGCAGAAVCARTGAALSASNAATESRRRRVI